MIIVCKDCGLECTTKPIAQQHWTREHGFESCGYVSECCEAETDEFLDEEGTFTEETWNKLTTKGE